MEAQAHLRKLLEAYGTVAWHAVASPKVVFLQRSRGTIGRFVWLPRPTWFTKYFVVEHIRRRTDELERRIAAQATLADDRDRYARQLEMLADFRRSLPPTISRRLLISFTVAATLWTTRLLSQWLLNLSNASDNKEMKVLVELEDSVLSLNVHGRLFDQIATSSLGVVVDLLFGLALCTYAVLRCAYPGFRLMRVVFNDYPALPKGRNWGQMHEHVNSATGLYGLEREVFSTLEAKAKPEFPFDLAVSAIFVSCWVAMGVYMLKPGSDQTIFVGIFFVCSGLVWFALLARASRFRKRNPAEPDAA